jgi:hypothetical protein
MELYITLKNYVILYEPKIVTKFTKVALLYRWSSKFGVVHNNGIAYTITSMGLQ